MTHQDLIIDKLSDHQPSLFYYLFGSRKSTQEPRYAEEYDPIIKAFVETRLKDEHTLDLAPFDQGPEPHDLFKTELNEFRRRFASRSGIGIVLMCFCIGAWYAARWFAIEPAILSALSPYLFFAPAIFALGALAIYEAKVSALRGQCLQPRARDILTGDKRRPVLLIRSFKDDEAPIYHLEQVSWSDGKGGYHTTSTYVASRFEEAFAAMFNRIGPLVAVGNPRDKFNDAGAARARFSDQNWQQPVIDLINQSRVIALVAGWRPDACDEDLAKSLMSRDLFGALDLTPGVRWEIEYLVNQGYLNKLIVLLKPPEVGMPFYGAKMRRRWRRLWRGDVTGDAAPDFADFVLLFYKDGQPKLIKAEGSLHAKEDYELAIRMAAYEMLCAAALPTDA